MELSLQQHPSLPPLFLGRLLCGYVRAALFSHDPFLQVKFLDIWKKKGAAVGEKESNMRKTQIEKRKRKRGRGGGERERDREGEGD